MIITIRPMQSTDYLDAATPWRATEGLGDVPSKAAFHRFLTRNPGLSQVAEVGGTIAGALLVSFDGIRGCFYRLAVAASHRHQCVARRLVEAAGESLRQAGADRVNLHLYADNVAAQAFWPKAGWRPDPRIEFWTRRW